MIGYATVGTNDLPRALEFYDKLLGSLGAKRGYEGERGAGWSTTPDAPMLAVMKPFDGQLATVGNGTMIALALQDRAQVDALHKLALELGGSDEGPAGLRGGNFYAGYFRDLDGNKLCGFCYV